MAPARHLRPRQALVQATILSSHCMLNFNFCPRRGALTRIARALARAGRRRRVRARSVLLALGAALLGLVLVQLPKVVELGAATKTLDLAVGPAGGAAAAPQLPASTAAACAATAAAATAALTCLARR
jgi:hypothetical protein